MGKFVSKCDMHAWFNFTRYSKEASKPSKEELEEEEDCAAVLKLSDEYISKAPSGILEKIAQKKRME